MQERPYDEIPFVKRFKCTHIFADLRQLKKLGAEAVDEGKTLETLKKSLVFLVFKMTFQMTVLANPGAESRYVPKCATRSPLPLKTLGQPSRRGRPHHLSSVMRSGRWCGWE